MSSFSNGMNNAASWFVNLPVGWQMLLALLVLVPICFVIARFLLLPLIDAVYKLYKRHAHTSHPAENVGNKDVASTTSLPDNSKYKSNAGRKTETS